MGINFIGRRARRLQSRMVRPDNQSTGREIFRDIVSILAVVLALSAVGALFTAAIN